MPKRKIEHQIESNQQKSGISSRFFNWCFNVFLRVQIYFWEHVLYVMVLFWVFIVIAAIPPICSGISVAYDKVISSIGWQGLAEAILIPTALILGLRAVWLWKGLRARNGKMTLSTLRCFAGFHDYKFVEAYQETCGPLIFDVSVSKCSRCSSTNTEGRENISNYY